jgi:archaellum component FlaF (FlaF/FlaG flagellin family)
MENAIPTLVIGALLLVASALITHSNIEAQSQLSQSFRDMQARLGAKAQTELKISDATLDPDLQTLDVSVLNDGQTRISDYEKMDVIVVYETASGRVTKWLPFSSSGPAGDTWSLASISDDSFEPGLINPGETAQIVVDLADPAVTGQSNRIVIVSDSGVATSTPFTS